MVNPHRARGLALGMGAPGSEDEAQTGVRATLARTVEAVGPGIVDLLTSPSGDVEVLGPRIFDPLDPAAIGPGDVVLAVNVSGEDQVRQVVARAAAGGAAAVALKASGDELKMLAEVAGSAGVAILAVFPAVTWDQLHTLLRNAVTAAGAAPPGEDTTPLGDLFALANAVAAMVGGAVTIEDPQSNVLAYSSLDHAIDEPRRQTILGRRVPEPWTRRLRAEGIFRQVWSSPGAVRFEDEASEAQPRLITAIRAGTEVIGTIWVLEGDRPLGPDAEQALCEAARLAALHVLRHQASDDLARRERSNLLRGLLEGHRPAADAGAALGIDPAGPCAVVGFRLQLEDDAERSLKRARAVDLITVYCEALRRRAACAWMGDTVYVLLPSLDGPAARRVMPLASDIADHAAEALKVAVLAGVGSTVPTVGDARRSRREADQVLRIIGRDGGGRVAHIDDVRVEVILEELTDLLRDRPDLHHPALDALAEHDRQRSTAYLPTLRAYLDAFGDVSAAAETINLHPNSFRYRLRRLRELTGIDLTDPDGRLVIALQLRLAE